MFGSATCDCLVELRQKFGVLVALRLRRFALAADVNVKPLYLLFVTS